MKYLLLFLVVFVSACATWFEGGNVGIEIATKVGTAKFIERNPSEVSRVIYLAERGISFANSGVVISPSDFAVLVKREVDYHNLALSDRILVDALIGRITFELSVDTVDLVGAKQVFEWILETARMYD